MLKFLFSLLFLIIGIGNSLSTDILVYTYDNAGNRLIREKSVSSNAVKSRNVKDSLQLNSNIMMFDTKIIVSPNPTIGKFSVEIISNIDLNPIISIYSLSGNLIYNTENQMRADFDLSGYISGIYIVSVDFNGEKRIFKIIKK